jgi:hypothetical protein
MSKLTDLKTASISLEKCLRKLLKGFQNMGKFHIKANGEPGRCVAQPGNCKFAEDDDHHYTKEAARKAYEKANAQDTIESYNRKHVPNSELTPEGLEKRARVTQALTSDLNYTGKAPRWLSKLQKESQATYGPGGEPKIIDVIDSPVGPLAVVWSNQTLRKNDASIINERGFNIREISLVNMKDGENQGYLKAAFVDDDSCKRAWGDDDYSGIRYLDEYDGSNFGIKEYVDPPRDAKGKLKRDVEFKKIDILKAAKTPDERLEAKKKIWAASGRALKFSVKDEQGEYVPYYNLNASHAPKTEEELDEAMKPVQKTGNKKLEDFKKDFKNPYVDFARTNDAVQGQGLGSAMYIYTARMLGKENKILRGSGLQSESAKGAWEGLTKDARLPVGKMTQYWSKSDAPSVCPVLDFRANKAAA